MQRRANILIIGYGIDQGHAARFARRDALVHQIGGIDQEAGGDAFIQSVPFEVARGGGDLDQGGGQFQAGAGLGGDDPGLEVRRRVVEDQG